MKENWTYKKLGEIANYLDDGDWIESKDQSSSGIRLIQTGNVGNGFFISKDDKPHYISSETFNSLKCKEIFAGDCLISRLPEPVGRACIIPQSGYRMITAVDCMIIRFKDILNSSFFVYYSKSKQYNEDVYKKTTGTTRKRISRKNLESISIPVPPIAEQERIVEELDLLSGVIEKQKQQLKELDTLAQSIFYDTFGDPITNEKNWPVKNYGQEFKIGSGGTPSKSMPEYWENGDIPWIGSNMCQNQIVYKTDGKFITLIGLEKSSSKLVDSGNVLVALVGATIGKVALLKTKTAINQNIAFIATNESDKFNSYFVYYHLMSLYSLFLRIGNGDFKMANLSFVRSLPILLPPLSLQEEFAEKIEMIEKQKEAIGKSIKETQLLFDYTMDKYFG